MKTCYYKFPCHPHEMVANSPRNVTPNVRMLRAHMITTIAELSQQYDQQTLDTKLYADVDASGDIVGLDMSKLVNLGINMCQGTRIPLGQLTAKHWSTMRFTN